jgi:dTDP-4-amino-4,6-dideoxygalactose transaminase
MVMMALRIGPGDEVITTPFTFVATAEVVCRLGARPVFVDLEPDSLLLRSRAVPDRVNGNTRAILPVHLYGRMHTAANLIGLAEETDLPVIEDCAQSLGARSQDRSAGTLGLAGAFSFFPTKNLGGWGDGGMLITNDQTLAGRLRQIRDHGSDGQGAYQFLGGNFRLDTIQAAVLLEKLTHLDDWLQARREAARNYDRLFVEATLVAGPNETRHPGHRIFLPSPGGEGEHAFNLYVIRAERRDELKQHLDQAGITAAVYYPTPLHLQPSFAHLGYKPGDLPVAEEASRSVLALPLYPDIRQDQQERVVETIADFYRKHP